MGWYQKHRPTCFEEVLGQDHVTGPLNAMLHKNDLPHFLLFAGGSGWGKTTVARVLQKRLRCSDHDFVEVNAVADGGIDFVRDVKKNYRMCPLGGKCRIWLIDEAHGLSRQAQQAFLKETEDVPDHVYFIFASSEADTLIPAMHTRATRFDFKPVGRDDLMELMRAVLAAENAAVSKKVTIEIMEAANGSARHSLVMLEQAASAADDEQALQMVRRTSPEAVTESLAKILLGKTWGDAQKFLKQDGLDPEGVRRGVMAYMAKGLVEGWAKPPAKAAKALQVFQFLYSNGKPDLVRCCWEFFNS